MTLARALLISLLQPFEALIQLTEPGVDRGDFEWRDISSFAALLQSFEDRSTTQFSAIFNWTEELKRLVPTDD